MLPVGDPRDLSVWRPSPKLRRLRSMSLSEIAYRGRQEAAKAFERLTPAVLPERQAWLRTYAPAFAGEDAALRAIRERLPARFFAGAAQPDIAATLDERCPGACRQIVEAAEGLLQHRFDLLGYRDLSFGDPIDWHLDPVWKRRAPLVHWSRLDALDTAIVGDSKIVWELNRHQWLVRLAQAWQVTGDVRYAAACMDAMDRWRAANPAGRGINWASSLEVAFRLMSWCWVVMLIRNAPVMTNAWATGFVTAMWQHATHISRYLSYYSSPNTHLTGEALGLFHAGILLSECRDAGHWREVATRVLLAECRRQLTPDGIHFEQSTCYQRYTADTYLTLIALAHRNGLGLPHELMERTAQVLDVLVAVRRPDGAIPPIGDGDGGELLPLVDRDPGDCRGTFAVAAAVLSRADFAWAAEGATPELLWLLGRQGLNAFDALAPAPPGGDSASRLFPSGYAVMRSGWERDAHQLIADVGPLGCPTSSGHGHADLLAVQCSIFGEACLVDAGTYCYTAEPRWRDYFRGTAAHSTVRVDRLDQAEPAGPFRWHQRPRARLRTWHSNPGADVIDADHDGYLRLDDPVSCRRRIVFVKPDYWLIVDDVDGADRHTIEQTFQFAAGVHIATAPGGWLRIETPGARVLWMFASASTPVETALSSGEEAPIRGWTSSDYGRREPAPALVFTAEASLPWRILTLLVPDPGGSQTPPPAVTFFDRSGRPAGVTFDRPRRSARVDDQAVVIT
jgi:hypothetical protein